MTQWRIDPAAANTIADTVALSGESLADTKDGDGVAFSETTLADLGANLDQGDVLVQASVAVNQLLEAEGQNITNVLNAISGATVGLCSVVAMYEYAGAEMGGEMSEAQSEAISAAETGDFSYFLEDA